MSNYKVGDRVRVTVENNSEGIYVFDMGDTGEVTQVLSPVVYRPYTVEVKLDSGKSYLFAEDEITLVRERGYVITRGELEDLLAWDDRNERRKIVDNILRGGEPL